LKNSDTSESSANKTRKGLFLSQQEINILEETVACPLVRVEAKELLLHLIHFSGQPMLNQKTRTGFSCEIWAMIDKTIGFTYLATENQSPSMVKYSSSAIGKTVAYRLRWTDKRGNGGSWSETHYVTIE
jgi:hypothetical protein